VALLAEEIVGEWLNRQGYFTIRGIKVGVHEMYLLAIRITAISLECRHLEVQASMRAGQLHHPRAAGGSEGYGTRRDKFQDEGRR
jgi:hypothetical protein